MCRAVWVLIATADDDTFKLLRRACGIEAQVVGRIGSSDDVSAQSATPADVVIVDAAMRPALLDVIRESMPEAGIVWFGQNAPDGAHHATGELDAIEGGITKALIARRS